MCDKIKKNNPGLDYFVFLFLTFLGAIEDSGAVWRKKKVNITAHHVFSRLPWQTKDSPKQKERQLARKDKKKCQK